MVQVIACMFTQQGKNKGNQDAMVAWEEFWLKKDIVLFGVFNSHGICGL